MKSKRFFPLALILTGLFLLLMQFRIVSLNRPLWFIIGSALLGLFLLQRSIDSKHKKGLLGGSFFMLIATGLSFMQFGLLPISDEIGFGMLFVALGLANFIYFIFTRLRLSGLVYGLLYTSIGTLAVAGYYYNIDWWVMSEWVELYWPVVLILFGLALLADGLRHNNRHSTSNPSNEPGSWTEKIT
ncbi:MAG: hypothetical protein D6677_10785 [Calditrichaeota bacterium]|nr:MAG: hypothetical protein D6677_10785 [Calditrichota bacterium]